MDKSWYYREVKKQLAMGPTTHKRMVEVLAQAAGASADYSVQLSSVLAWLEYVGLIVITNGFVQLGQELYKSGDSGDGTPPEGSQTPASPEGQESTTDEEERPTPPERGATVLSLGFDLALTTEDLHKLTSEQITALFEAVGKVAAIKATMQ